MISGSVLINAIVYLAIVGVIFYVLWWMIDKFAVPEPMNKVIRVLLALVCGVIVIGILLDLLPARPVSGTSHSLLR